MNLVIDYDFFNAIKDVNEELTLNKIIRNNMNKWLKFNIPLLTSLEYVIAKEKFLNYMPSALAIHFFIIFQMELMQYKLLGDIYKDTADIRLKLLVSQLDNLNLETTYELLKQSTCYRRIYNLKLNKNKIPQVLESKYILVPNYDYHGDIKETSLLQEHIVGSNNYILSIGEPKKVLKLAYSKI